MVRWKKHMPNEKNGHRFHRMKFIAGDAGQKYNLPGPTTNGIYGYKAWKS